MRDSPPRSLQEWLGRQDARCVEDWLRTVQSGQGQVPEDFNWQVVAEVADMRAHGRRPDEDLAWARVATWIYEHPLAREAAPADASIRESIESAAMLLRADMIRRLGPIAGDPVLDPDTIVRWFVDRLPLSRQQASEQAACWRATRSLSSAQLRTLTFLKERLRVLGAVAEARGVVLSDEVEAWLELRERLP